MKAKQHLVVIAVGAFAFCCLVFALGATMKGIPAWYHEPAVFPLRVAIWASGNLHNPNALAGSVALAFECALVGLVGDLCIVGIRRWNRRVKTKA
jgi:hypothetical protein